ncbi:MAG: lipopolysaccharide biosynthesis protein [Promethearchaeota archaeon]
MDDIPNQEGDSNARKSTTKLARNSFLSIMEHYSTYLFGLIHSAILARIIERSLIGILAYATSTIAIFSLILIFLPPGLDESLVYYIPKLKAQNQEQKLRKLLLHMFYVRLIATFILFTFCLLIITGFSAIFNTYSEGNLIVLYILSPSILFSGIGSFLTAVCVGSGYFKTTLKLKLLNYFFNLISLLAYLLIFANISIEIIALIDLFSIIIPVLINILVFIHIIRKLPSGEKSLKLKSSIKMISTYGGFTLTETFTSRIWDEVQIQGVRIFDTADSLVGYKYSNNYSSTTHKFIGGLRSPLTITFSGLFTKNDLGTVNRITNITLKYTHFLLFILIGLFFFGTELFLYVVYQPSFLDFTPIFQLRMLTISASPINLVFYVLLKSSKRVKLMPHYYISFMIVCIIGLFIGLISFGIYGALISLICINFLFMFINLFLILKLFKLEINSEKLLLFYISFAFSLLIAILLDKVLFHSINITISEWIGIYFIRYIKIFPFLTFLATFLVFNYTLQLFTKNDLKYIEERLINKKFAIRILNIIKKFLR